MRSPVDLFIILAKHISTSLVGCYLIQSHKQLSAILSDLSRMDKTSTVLSPEFMECLTLLDS